MAEDVKGTAHLFGAAGTIVSDATIVSLNPTHRFDLSETTNDGETGKVIETRKDDRVKEITVTLRLQSSATLPSLGDVLAVSGLVSNLSVFEGNYEVDNIGATLQARSYVEIELTLIQHEGISYSV